MPLSTELQQRVDAFFHASRFCDCGGVVTDLDGTAILEEEGRIYISQRMEAGLKRIHELGRPVMINSLRFPQSVLKTFAADWHRITGAPIPVVSLKGSQTGRIVAAADGDLVFEEHDAVVLEPSEVEELLKGVEGMLQQGLDDLLVFHYPRDWRIGELIWTPRADRVDAVAAKYRSAARVTSTPFEQLRADLLARETCMVFLLVDAPEDRRMAYQHTAKQDFFVHQGVSKKHGAARLAPALGMELAHSVGAGDAPPDDFLSEVGLAVIVGNQNLDYKGAHDTLRVGDSQDLGDLLFALGRLQRQANQS